MLIMRTQTVYPLRRDEEAERMVSQSNQESDVDGRLMRQVTTIIKATTTKEACFMSRTIMVLIIDPEKGRRRKKIVVVANEIATMCHQKSVMVACPLGEIVNHDLETLFVNQGTVE
jgi:hypothetical protein